MSQQRRTKDHQPTAQGDGHAAIKGTYGSVVINYPDYECYELSDDYLIATGSASSDINRAVVVWGKIFQGSVDDSTQPTPWYNGQLPHAQHVQPSTNSWSLGPMPVYHNSVNTLIVWAVFPNEEGFARTSVEFQDSDDCNAMLAAATKKVAKKAAKKKPKKK